MSENAVELGVRGVTNVIRHLLVKEYGVERHPDNIDAREELFEKGLGLSSLQGLTLLIALEEHFDIQVNELEWSMHERPTIEAVAAHIVRLAGGM
jgi:acyl carrier protein